MMPWLLGKVVVDIFKHSGSSNRAFLYLNANQFGWPASAKNECQNLHLDIIILSREDSLQVHRQRGTKTFFCFLSYIFFASQFHRLLHNNSSSAHRSSSQLIGQGYISFVLRAFVQLLLCEKFEIILSSNFRHKKVTGTRERLLSWRGHVNSRNDRRRILRWRRGNGRCLCWQHCRG